MKSNPEAIVDENRDITKITDSAIVLYFPNVIVSNIPITFVCWL